MSDIPANLTSDIVVALAAVLRDFAQELAESNSIDVARLRQHLKDTEQLALGAGSQSEQAAARLVRYIREPLEGPAE